MRKIACLTLRRHALLSLRRKDRASVIPLFKTFLATEYKRISPLVPDIGRSLFAFNYESAPATFAIYSSLLKCGLSSDEAVSVIWESNERLFAAFPFSLRRIWGKRYLRQFERNASKHVARQKKGALHPLDWKMEYLGSDGKTIALNVTECAYQKLAKELGLEGILPGICRMDYLLASMTGTGFERSSTLGDGDPLCDCRYSYAGSVTWPVKDLK